MQLAHHNAQPTMTSLEIAELTGKEHGHVKRDIGNMLDALGRGEDASKFGYIYSDGQNRQQTAYRLPYDETICLLTGYDARARMAVIKRWQELEAPAQPVFQVPTTLSGALRLAAEQADVIEQQALALAAAAPAIAFVEKYADSTGLKGFRQVCKLLGAKENDFREFLLDKKIMYRLGGEWMPTAQHLDTGRFVVKAGTAKDNAHAFNSAKFTPKGVHWVAGEYAKYQLEQKS